MEAAEAVQMMTKRNIITSLILGLILVALPVTIYLAQQTQIFKPRASGLEGQIWSIQPNPVVKTSGSWPQITIDVGANEQSWQLLFRTAVGSCDKNSCGLDGWHKIIEGSDDQAGITFNANANVASGLHAFALFDGSDTLVDVKVVDFQAPPPCNKPSQPSGLAYEKLLDGRITVSWNTASGADRYDVRLVRPNGLSQLNHDNVGNTWYTFAADDVSSAGTYSWWVEASNDCGSVNQGGSFTKSTFTVLNTPDTADACDETKVIMSTTSPSSAPKKVGESITFSYSGSQGSTLTRNGWSGGVNQADCAAGLFVNKNCKATEAGNFIWTHSWKNCAENRCETTNAGPPITSDQCLKSAPFTIAAATGTGGTAETVTIGGKVTKADTNAGIPGVVVQVYDDTLPSDKTRSDTTKADGSFSIANFVRTGDSYKVSVPAAPPAGFTGLADPPVYDEQRAGGTPDCKTSCHFKYAPLTVTTISTAPGVTRKKSDGSWEPLTLNITTTDTSNKTIFLKKKKNADGTVATISSGWTSTGITFTNSGLQTWTNQASLNLGSGIWAFGVFNSSGVQLGSDSNDVNFITTDISVTPASINKTSSGWQQLVIGVSTNDPEVGNVYIKKKSVTPDSEGWSDTKVQITDKSGSVRDYPFNPNSMTVALNPDTYIFRVYSTNLSPISNKSNDVIFVAPPEATRCVAVSTDANFNNNSDTTLRTTCNGLITSGSSSSGVVYRYTAPLTLSSATLDFSLSSLQPSKTIYVKFITNRLNPLVSAQRTIKYSPEVDFKKFEATPSSVVTGGSATVSWQIENADRCTATGDWPNTITITLPRGSVNLTDIRAAKTLGLECFNKAGVKKVHEPITITVTNLIPTCTNFKPRGLTAISSSANGPVYTTADFNGGELELEVTKTAGSVTQNPTQLSKTPDSAGNLVFVLSANPNTPDTYFVRVPVNSSSAGKNSYTVSAKVKAADNQENTCPQFILEVPVKPIDTSCPSDILSTEAKMKLTDTDPLWSLSQTIILNRSVRVAGFHNNQILQMATDVQLEAIGPEGPLSQRQLLNNPQDPDPTKRNNVQFTPLAEGRYTISATTIGKDGNSTRCTNVGHLATLTVNPAPVPLPTVTLTANPTTVAKDGTASLTWTTTNLTTPNSCAGTIITPAGFNDPNWVKAQANSSTGVTTVPLPNPGTSAITYTYRLTCTNAGGSAFDEKTISVSPAAACRPGLVPGDATGEGDVNGLDYNRWRNEFKRVLDTKTADFDCSGTIDQLDYNIWRNEFRKTLGL